MSAIEPVFNVDRHTSIENRVDALGKRWDVVSKRGGGLVYAASEQTKQTPKCMEGLWTSAAKLNTQIDLHLKDTWDKADEQLKLAAGKERARIAREEEKAQAEAVMALAKAELAKKPKVAKKK